MCMNEEVLVSIYCLAYNHGRYIRDALEGFVRQKTTFRYEVIIHDDASQDDTAKIIEEYAQKYPDIIKPIIQVENMYSKGVDILRTFIKPKVQGKYIAICEGDDYWITSDKLQKQVDFLETHIDYSACVHNTIMRDMKKNKDKVMFANESNTLTLADVVRKGSQSYHTSSVMYRAEYLFERPDYVDCIRGIGDYPLSIYLISQGKIYYYADAMSLYRFNVAGSWTARRNRTITINMYKGIIKMLSEAQKVSEVDNQDLFEDTIKQYTYLLRLAVEDYDVLKEKEYRKYYLEEPFIGKIKILIKKNLRFVYTIYKKTRKD